MLCVCVCVVRPWHRQIGQNMNYLSFEPLCCVLSFLEGGGGEHVADERIDWRGGMSPVWLSSFSPHTVVV